jgi:hypothetical protein
MWRKCSTCKAAIGFEQSYYLCSVSTCSRSRTGLFFCSLACWDAHLPMMRHRDAWAVEERAPSEQAWQKEQEEQAMADQPDSDAGKTERRRVVPSRAEPPSGELQNRADAHSGRAEAAPDLEDADLPRDVLVVVSKLKAYVKARSGMNTSDAVVNVLSDHLRRLCTEAIRNAARDGRKTVLDRDFLPLL